MEIKRYVDFCGEGGGTAEASYGERGQYVGAPDFDRILAERDALQQRLNELGEQHQGEPVAYAVFTDNGNIRIWSTKVMQEEGKQVVPLYAHSAPSATAEVERLREELDAYEHGSSVEAEEADSLRKQLAEAHALLREVLVGLWPSTPLAIKINAALSASAEPKCGKCHGRGLLRIATVCGSADKSCPECASAEPSAPVERDERAAFELVIGQKWPGIRMLRINRPGAPADGEYELPGLEAAWQGWQAHAALERKP